MAETLDELSEFEIYRRDVLPELRKAIAKGASAKEIYKRHEAYAAARAVTIAITETDTGKALAAAKEILDRGGGKATEHKEIAISNLTDQELDDLLKKELGELTDDETKSH